MAREPRLSLACNTRGRPHAYLSQLRLCAVLNDPTYVNDTIRREHSPPRDLH
jgi:hypothetical protein